MWYGRGGHGVKARAAVVYTLRPVWHLDAIDQGRRSTMRTLPLSAQLADKIIEFESIVRKAGEDGRITETEAVRIICAGRAMGRDAGSLAEAVDFCGTVLHGTAGIDSPRVIKKMRRVIRRENVIDLYPEIDSAA
jgi:hypothetical protein